MGKKIILFLEIFIIFMAIMVLGLVYLEDQNKNESFYADNIYQLGGWQLLDLEGNASDISLPVRLSEKEPRTIIQRKLKEDISGAPFLLFYSAHASIKVYSDDRLIYEYSNKKGGFFPLEGNGYHLIKLDFNDQGSMITIVQDMAVEKYMGRLSEVYLTDKASAMISIIKWNTVGIITCILILALSVILIFLWMATKNIIGDNRLLNLSIFAFLIFLWSANETMMTQLVMGHLKLIMVISYFSIMLLPIPILHFFTKSGNLRIRYISSKFIYLPIVNFVLVNIIQFLKIRDYSEMLFTSHLIILSVIVMMILGQIPSKGDKFDFSKLFVGEAGIKFGIIGFFFMSLMIMMDLGFYYFGDMRDNAMFSRIGILFYIIALCIDTLEKTFQMVMLGQKADDYKYIAYHDKLTNVRSRAFYNEELLKIDNNPGIRKHTGILLVDINDLKVINDSYGHEAGDKYILESVVFLMKYIKGMGSVYRIGGDEFVVITHDDRSEEIVLSLNRMEEDMKQNNDISFAFGYAVYDEHFDVDINDTVKRADELMYERKNKMKIKK
jgi:diguanylate cyclase (GGDEF)-like protein